MMKRLSVRVNSRWYSVEVGDPSTSPVRVLVDGEALDVEVEGLSSRPSPGPAPEVEASEVGKPPDPATRTPSPTKVFRTPMPGIILSVSVTAGDQVVTGDEVCVLEAMKMRQSLRADWTGIVRAVYVSQGQQVLSGDAILELE